MFVEHKEAMEVTEQPAELAGWQRLLLKAASLIEIRGHNKGSFEREGRLCFRGAVNMADSGMSYNGGGECDEASVRLLRALRAEGNCPKNGWLEWNDAPERTAEEVVSKMRAVALMGEC